MLDLLKEHTCPLSLVLLFPHIIILVCPTAAITSIRITLEVHMCTCWNRSNARDHHVIEPNKNKWYILWTIVLVLSVIQGYIEMSEGCSIRTVIIMKIGHIMCFTFISTRRTNTFLHHIFCLWPNKYTPTTINMLSYLPILYWGVSMTKKLFHWFVISQGKNSTYTWIRIIKDAD